MPLLPESLLTDSTIWLFGRVLEDLTLRNAEASRQAYAGRSSVTQLLRDELLAEDARIARIYAFSFQNELFDLVKPALFLVNGGGEDLERARASAPVRALGLNVLEEFLAADLRGWAYDREDVSVRMDVMTGPLDRILLDYELTDDGFQPFSARGGAELGRPAPMGNRRRGKRSRRWRAEDE